MKIFLYLIILFPFNLLSQKIHIPDKKFKELLLKNFPECFLDDSLKSNCPTLLLQDSLDFSFQNILNITGIEYFKNLKILNVNSNNILFLPILPSKLKRLECYNNKIEKLPALPQGLQFLDCSRNNLKKLPFLPDSLCYLISIFGNDINCIPNLPSSCQEILYFDIYNLCAPDGVDNFELDPLKITNDIANKKLLINTRYDHKLISVDIFDAMGRTNEKMKLIDNELDYTGFNLGLFILNIYTENFQYKYKLLVL